MLKLTALSEKFFSTFLLVEQSLSEYQPVIIIGAGRSGTNMLRDALVAQPGFATWPCDEINYIWRHGNRSYPNDEIPACLAEPVARKYIGRKFDQMADRAGCSYLVEKTCANSLRVPFVDAVVPRARYICLIRDGADVVASATKRWGAKLDLPYIAKKARFVPVGDLPFYACRYGIHRLRKLVTSENTLPTWGPIYKGMKEDAQCRTLAEVCALQWLNCVKKSTGALSVLPNDRVLTIRYEEFVASPESKLTAVLEFLEAPVSSVAIGQAVSNISSGSVGGGSELSKQLPLVSEILEDLRRELGYV